MRFTVFQIRRLGQITGTTGAAPFDILVDPIGQPLLTDTGTHWKVFGVDEGPSAEHSDGRLYFYFGDVNNDNTDVTPLNADLVAWTDEPNVLFRGGHLAQGLNFHLPITGAGPDSGGQPHWQGCSQCSTLFYNGDPTHKGVCPLGGTHVAQGDDYSVPSTAHTSIPGSDLQSGWRCCGPCAALFWEGDGPGVTRPCPAAGSHVAAGDFFSLPTVDAFGRRPDWRPCTTCHGVFFDGFSGKGICYGAAGGGIHLQAVTGDGTPSGRYDPFRAADPIGYTGSNETPNGAFSFDGRMYVFAGIADFRYTQRVRPTDPQLGQYLFSKTDPSKAGPYDTEFLFSPTLGCCAQDDGRRVFRSHRPAGWHYLLVHDFQPPLPAYRGGWRCCSQCEAVFFSGAAVEAGVCQRGGPHIADPLVPEDFQIEVGLPDAVQDEADWRECGNCAALFRENDGNGRCPNDDSGAHVHRPTGEVFRVPHTLITSTTQFRWGQPDWRFCDKCCSLFWGGDGPGGVCPRGGAHEAAGFNLILPFRPNAAAGDFRLCANCAALFGPAFNNHCPATGGAAHQPIGWGFIPRPAPPPPAAPNDPPWQGDWAMCAKCAELYFDPDRAASHCPADAATHLPSGNVYALQHNPGADAHTRDMLRYCEECHGLVRADQPIWYVATSPTCVNSAEHPALPVNSGSGVVMFSYDWAGVRLSWMPLTPGQRPDPDTVLHYRVSTRQWATEIEPGADYHLFTPSVGLQDPHVCGTWLPGPKLWIVTYSLGGMNTTGAPIMARFSADLTSWSDEVPIFTAADGAGWMHRPGQPIYPGSQDNQGWAYGPFVINRYTRWNRLTHTIELRYLLSSSSPYQVHLMETQVVVHQD